MGTESQLTVALPELDLNLDPHSMEDAYSMEVNLQLHRGLLRYSPSGDVHPDLAESWSESADHRIYTFKLRQANFSDGTRIQASHVVQSFARIFYLGSSFGADIEYIEGAKKFIKSKNLADLGIKAKGTDLVEVRLSEPSFLITKHLAAVDAAILKLDDFKATPKAVHGLIAKASSGPYRFKSEDKNGTKGRVILEKWRTDTFDSKAPPRFLEFVTSGESPSILARLGKNDCLDHAPLPPLERTELIRNGWVESLTDVAWEVYVVVNPKRFSLPERRWLYNHVNTSEMIKIFPSTTLRPAYGLIPTGLPGELGPDMVKGLSKNLEAKAPRGVVELEFANKGELRPAIAAELKARFDTADFKVILKPLNQRDWIERASKGKCDFVIDTKGLDYFDGYSVLTYFRSGYSGNTFHVADANIDKKLDAAVKILDLESRLEEYRKLQVEILRHHTILPLFFGSQSAGLWSAKVRHVPAHPGGVHTLPFETIEMR